MGITKGLRNKILVLYAVFEEPVSKIAKELGIKECIVKSILIHRIEELQIELNLED